MTKMTDEELERRLQHIATQVGQNTGRVIRAHITALTAERDDWEGEAKAHNAAATQYEADIRDLKAGREMVERRWAEARDERSTLCERVKALEAERDEAARERSEGWARAQDAESRLAAIRQRAGVKDWTPKTWEAIRYVVGDDAPAPSETQEKREDPCGECGRAEWHPSCPPSETIGTPCDCGGVPHTHEAGEDCTRNEPSELDGLRGGMADPGEQGPECSACPERGDFERLCCKGPHQKVAAEPTTAEAFAMVCGEPLYSGFSNHGKHALSLLERRTGMQERVLRLVLTAWKAHEVTGSPALFYDVERALTDAPSVLTLEEVETATMEPTWTSDLPTDHGAGYREGFAAAMRTVRKRLTALRR